MWTHRCGYVHQEDEPKNDYSLGTMLIEFLIPAYNRPSVERAVDSILSQLSEVPDPSRVGVTVVDDAGEIFSVLELPRVDWEQCENLNVKRNRTNLGMSRNLLSMVKDSSADYVFILTDDDYLEKGALNHCLSVLQPDFPHSGYLTPRIGWDEDGMIRVVDCQISRSSDRVIGDSIVDSIRYANQGHILSGLVLRRSAISVEHWERFVDNAYFPMAIVSDILKDNTMVYEPKCIVHHTVYNETFWHRWGSNEAEIASRLYLDYVGVVSSAANFQESSRWTRIMMESHLLRTLIRHDLSWIIHYGNSQRPTVTLGATTRSQIYAMARWVLERVWRPLAWIHRRIFKYRSDRRRVAPDRFFAGGD